MKKILIPTDLTLHSLGLIKYALHLLKGETCQIKLLHLIPMPDSLTELLTMPREAARPERPNAAFLQALERLQRSYAIEINDISIDHVYCDNSFHIKNLVVRHRIDLVLCPVPVGKASEALGLFNRLVQDVPCPVLFMPEFFEINRFRKIAFVLDAEDKTSALPSAELVGLLCRNDYHIMFLLAFKPGTHTDKLKLALDNVYSSKEVAGVHYSVHLIHRSDVASGLVSFVEEFEVDLVVASKKKSVFDALRLNRKCFREKAIGANVPYLSVC